MPTSLYNTEAGIASSSTLANIVSVMEFYTFGAIWGNSRQPGAVGAAAAAYRNQDGEYFNAQIQSLPPDPPPTNQRATLLGIVIALRQALERVTARAEEPFLTLNIHSSSKNAIEIVTVLRYKWERRGWKNSNRKEPANRDLVQEVSSLHKTLEEWGEVRYIWIPRAENAYAQSLCVGDVHRQLHRAELPELVRQQSKSEVLDTVHQLSGSEVSEPVQQQSEIGVLDTVHQLSKSEVLDTVHQLSESEVSEPVQQQSETKISEPAHQQSESEISDAVQQLSELAVSERVD